MFFVCKIHNNSLGICKAVTSIEAGVEYIKDMVFEQFGELSENDIEHIEHDYEYYNCDDADNIFTFSLGQIE